MIKKNDILELNITDVSFAGLGVGAFSDSDLENFIIFVHNAVPGDRIMCRIVKTERNYAYGIIEKILDPSPIRTDIPCPTFEKCGGCIFLNINYEAELEIKRTLVSRAYSRHLQDAPEPMPVVASPETVHYRNKVICPLSKNGKFGFYARASHRNIENSRCCLQDPSFEKYFTAAEKYIKENNVKPYDELTGKGIFRQLYLRAAQKTGDVCVCAVINGKTLPNEEAFAATMARTGAASVYINENSTRGNTVLGRNFRLLYGKERITDELCGIKYEISPRAFYQINRLQAEALYRHAISLAKIDSDDIVLDLFCGIGTITLLAAEAGAKRVVGIEIVEEAIKDAQRNAVLNGLSNVDFFTADAADTLEIIEKCEGSPNIIIVDPPRKGLGEETVNAVAKLNPEKIVYISCNPETQAKDLLTLKAFGYVFDEIQPFDMFPKTQHVETVVLLTRDV